MENHVDQASGDRRKHVRDANERLAYAVASGQYSPVMACRLAGLDMTAPDAAAFIERKLRSNDFLAKVQHWQGLFLVRGASVGTRGVDEDVASRMDREWVLARLSRIYAIAMGESPITVNPDGTELYAVMPDLKNAIAALGAISRVLHLDQQEDRKSSSDDAVRQRIDKHRTEQRQRLTRMDAPKQPPKAGAQVN